MTPICAFCVDVAVGQTLLGRRSRRGEGGWVSRDQGLAKHRANKDTKFLSGALHATSYSGSPRGFAPPASLPTGLSPCACRQQAIAISVKSAQLPSRFLSSQQDFSTERTAKGDSHICVICPAVAGSGRRRDEICGRTLRILSANFTEQLRRNQGFRSPRPGIHLFLFFFCVLCAFLRQFHFRKTESFSTGPDPC